MKVNLIKYFCIGLIAYISSIIPLHGREFASKQVFHEISAQANINFQHVNGGFGKKYMPETVGSGVALFDYNNDRLLDVLFVNGKNLDGKTESTTSLRLFKNLGQDSFEDVTTVSGLEQLSFYGMGVAIADYDSNGFLDIFITSLNENFLFRNNDGKFEDVTRRAGLIGSSWSSQQFSEWSTSAVWFDYNKDGWLDLFVCNYVQWTAETDLFATLDGKNKSYATPELYKGLTNRLYKNNADGTFSDVTMDSGIYSAENKALGVALLDSNNDGLLDIFVANDTQPNALFINQGNGSFEEEGIIAGIAFDEKGLAKAGMGVDSAYLGKKLLVAVGNFSKEAISFFKKRRRFGFIDSAGRYGLTRHTLLSLTFGVKFLDYNNNGFQDLFIVNGHIEPDVEKVFSEITYRQLPQLFINRRNRRFILDKNVFRLLVPNGIVGRGLAVGDLNLDGKLDLVISTNNDKPLVLKNDTQSGNFISLRLLGKFPNRDAIGSRVTLSTGNKVQRKLVTGGGSYLSHSSFRQVHFGIGEADQVSRLKIVWPNGQISKFENLPAGKYYAVSQEKNVVDILGK
jgi:enediyne biosynthesis protein E4